MPFHRSVVEWHHPTPRSHPRPVLLCSLLCSFVCCRSPPPPPPPPPFPVLTILTRTLTPSCKWCGFKVEEKKKEPWRVTSAPSEESKFTSHGNQNQTDLNQRQRQRQRQYQYPTVHLRPDGSLILDHRDVLIGDMVALWVFTVYREIYGLVTDVDFPGWLAPLK